MLLGKKPYDDETRETIAHILMLLLKLSSSRGYFYMHLYAISMVIPICGQNIHQLEDTLDVYSIYIDLGGTQLCGLFNNSLNEWFTDFCGTVAKPL